MNIPYEHFQLANGLRCFVHHDPQVGKAVFDILYHVGAKDEAPERTGFAHLFEHLMFRGSKHISDYDVHVERAGGSNNAFTSNDVTNYFLELPANQIETAFWLESDRMLELAFSPVSLELEKSIVIEEFKQRYLNQPYGDAHLHLRPLLFQQHPYQWLTIGKNIDHVANASLEDVKAFFFNFYAPNNATLVVSGGVPREEVERLAEKWFGPIPARDVHKKPRTQEPPQEAPRSKTLYSTMAPHARVYKAYHIPGRSEPGYMPAEVIAELLTSGKSAWLYKRMVKDKEVASNIAAYSWGLFDTGQFSIDGTVAEGKSVAAYESALEAVLSELPNITAEELTRQKNKLEAEETFMKTSVMSRALGLALGDAIGDPDLINQELERIRQLQPQDIAHFAQQHFRPQNAATLYYLPEN